MQILNSKINLAAVRAISFDLDEVIIPYGGMEYKDILEVFREANMHAGKMLFPSICPMEARSRSLDAYNETGDPSKGFADLIKKEGWDENAFYDAFNDARNRNVWISFFENNPQIFSPCIHVMFHLSLLSKQGMPFGIVTHSHAEEWAKPALDLQCLKDCFQSVLGLETYRDNKADAPTGYEMSCQNLGVEAGAAHPFVEDTAKNLKPIKEQYPDTITVLRRDEPPTDEESKYVDVYTPHLSSFLYEVRQAQTEFFILEQENTLT